VYVLVVPTVPNVPIIFPLASRTVNVPFGFNVAVTPAVVDELELTAPLTLTTNFPLLIDKVAVPVGDTMLWLDVIVILVELFNEVIVVDLDLDLYQYQIP